MLTFECKKYFVLIFVYYPLAAICTHITIIPALNDIIIIIYFLPATEAANTTLRLHFFRITFYCEKIFLYKAGGV